jgi:hypothetical protein
VRPCEAADASAPTGRRNVATGGATPLSASRNPWEGLCFNTSAPAGRRNGRNARPISQTRIARRTLRPRPYALRPEHSQEFRPEALCPVGAKKEKRMMDLFPSSAFHGFRVGPPCGRTAPPVATPRRPAGAVTSRPFGLNGLKPFALRPVRKMVLCPPIIPDKLVLCPPITGCYSSHLATISRPRTRCGTSALCQCNTPVVDLPGPRSWRSLVALQGFEEKEKKQHE